MGLRLRTYSLKQIEERLNISEAVLLQYGYEEGLQFYVDWEDRKSVCKNKKCIQIEKILPVTIEKINREYRPVSPCSIASIFQGNLENARLTGTT